MRIGIDLSGIDSRKRAQSSCSEPDGCCWHCCSWSRRCRRRSSAGRRCRKKERTPGSDRRADRCGFLPPLRSYFFTSTDLAVIEYSIVTFAPTFRSPVTFVSGVRAISHFSLPFWTTILLSVTSEHRSGDLVGPGGAGKCESGDRGETANGVHGCFLLGLDCDAKRCNVQAYHTPAWLRHGETPLRMSLRTPLSRTSSGRSSRTRSKPFQPMRFARLGGRRRSDLGVPRRGWVCSAGRRRRRYTSAPARQVRPCSRMPAVRPGTNRPHGPRVSGARKPSRSQHPDAGAPTRTDPQKSTGSEKTSARVEGGSSRTLACASELQQERLRTIDRKLDALLEAQPSLWRSRYGAVRSCAEALSRVQRRQGQTPWVNCRPRRADLKPKIVPNNGASAASPVVRRASTAASTVTTPGGRCANLALGHRRAGETE